MISDVKDKENNENQEGWDSLEPIHEEGPNTQRTTISDSKMTGSKVKEIKYKDIILKFRKL